ncbi:MAG: trehalose-phosphatase [Candidatus Omnitrophica bacterium]|nr:trehalose-phosphatase [Candidatus Omnitrophota bacterium]
MRKKLLLLDFDGTLAPLAKTPQAVRLGRKIKKRLDVLSRSKNCIVVVVSGRSLKDLKSYFHSRRIIYIGNHGLELSGRGLRLPRGAQRARRRAHFVRLLARKLGSVFYFWEGVSVEDKGYTASLHFRNLRPDRLPVFSELVHFYRKKYERWPVVWRRGKKVWEIRPSDAWDKGDAALHLVRKFPGALAIAVGDDKTDEDMFRALRKKAVTVRVGRWRKSRAEYYLRSQKDVVEFLERCR